MDLTHKICKPCEGGVAPLTRMQAESLLTQISSDWKLSVDEKAIDRQIEFNDFKENMAFVNRVAELAEAEGHHPDMTILYNKLKLVLSTHSIGGLSENDFILAAKIDELYE